MPRPEHFQTVIRSLRSTLKSPWSWHGVLLWALALQSPAWADDCAPVQLQPIKPVQFGAVGLGAKRRGWIVLDQGGGYIASNEVALLGKLPPTPGLARVTAPPRSVVMLRAVVRNSVDPAYNVVLSNISLGFRSRPLEQNADYWVIRMPDSASSAPLSVEVSVGARLNFQLGGRIPVTQFLISLECVG